MNLNFLFKEITLFKKYKTNVTSICWFLLAFLTALSEVVRGSKAINNYQIFKNVFYHTTQQVNLYALYPDAHFDSNHYGIVFSILIAPFALLPNWAGCLLWCMANAAFLFYVICRLPLDQRNKLIILAIGLIEMLTATHNTQFNPMMTAFIIFPFILVNEEKEWSATFFIAAGFLIKLYGIVALVTFLFSKNKLKFIGWFIVWLLVLFCLPMIISSPSFVLQSYTNWYHSLDEKNSLNTSLGIVVRQNISVHGMLQRIFNLPGLSQLWVLLPAGLLNLLPLLRFKAYQSRSFRLLYLALCLLSVTIFSSSAESSTYIIAVSGVAIWFVLNDMKNKWVIALLIFTFIFTILSPTDLIPNFIQKQFFVKYSLKALPCFLVWGVIVVQLLTHNFTQTAAKADA